MGKGSCTCRTSVVGWVVLFGLIGIGFVLMQRHQELTDPGWHFLDDDGLNEV
ncbi:hypothetical protein [Stomatohabitans albus]|uniref:hypothetical protein n=1 Tax=Stomatohabitans albus TaxID=3110766 RepID=UPI00300DA34E